MTDRTPDREPYEDQPRCPTCLGDGWEVGHEDQCYEEGSCSCSGVQVPCSTCGGAS